MRFSSDLHERALRLPSARLLRKRARAFATGTLRLSGAPLSPVMEISDDMIHGLFAPHCETGGAARPYALPCKLAGVRCVFSAKIVLGGGGSHTTPQTREENR